MHEGMMRSESDTDEVNNFLRSVAATLSVGFCTIASANKGPRTSRAFSYGNQVFLSRSNTPQPGQYGLQSQFTPLSNSVVAPDQAVQTFSVIANQGPAELPGAGQKWNNFRVGPQRSPVVSAASTGRLRWQPADAPESISKAHKPNFARAPTATARAAARPADSKQHRQPPMHHRRKNAPGFRSCRQSMFRSVPRSRRETANRAPKLRMQSQFLSSGVAALGRRLVRRPCSCGIPAPRRKPADPVPLVRSFDLAVLNADNAMEKP